MRAGASEGNLLVYTPTKTWKLLSHASIVWFLLTLAHGSRHKDGVAPPSAFCMVNLNLLSKIGLVSNTPNSTYSLFKIFARILSDTRASMGKLAEVNNWVGMGALTSGSSPVRTCCALLMELRTREAAVISAGLAMPAWAGWRGVTHGSSVKAGGIPAAVVGGWLPSTEDGDNLHVTSSTTQDTIWSIRVFGRGDCETADSWGSAWCCRRQYVSGFLS